MRQFNKKELDLLFSVVVAGDTIIVTEVTRLAGSTKQLCEVLDLIKKLIIKNSLTLHCTGGQADPISEAFLQMAGKLNLPELARVCDLSRTTVYKYISLLEN